MKKTILYLIIPVFLLNFPVPVVSQEAAMTPPSAQDMSISGDADKISLELKGVDIIDVLKVLSKKSGLNIIAGKNVRGQVTLFLQDVNVMEALRAILQTSELAYEEQNGILKVITQRDYEAIYGKSFEDKRVMEIIKLRYSDAQTMSAVVNEIKSTIGKVIVDDRTNSLVVIDIPEKVNEIKGAILDIDRNVTSKIFSLRYSDVEEIEAKIAEMITPASGVLKADKRTNKIQITDFPEKINMIGKMIEAFDVVPKQVLIEAKIVEVTLNDDYAFGIDWDLVLEKKSGASLLAVDANDFGGLSDFGTGPLNSNSFTTFTINSATDDFFAVISALEGMGKTNTLSSPRLSVLNGEEAVLSVATRQPYVSQTVVQGDTTSTTADNIEFVDVGVILTVKPNITEDGKILLKVKPERSSLAANSPFTISEFDDNGNVVGTRASVPIVTTQEVETTVLIETGKTVVIGGLIQDTESKISRKVPILADIPLIGRGFKHETIDNTKSELVLFLTPNVIDVSHEDTEIRDNYLDPESGRMKKFNEVGEEPYDYEYTQKSSITPFRKHQKPFWDRQKDAEAKKELIEKQRLERIQRKEEEQRLILERQREEAERLMRESQMRQAELNRLTEQEGFQSAPQENLSLPVVSSEREQIDLAAQTQQAAISSLEAEMIALEEEAAYQFEISEILNRALQNHPNVALIRGLKGTLIVNLQRNGAIVNVGFPKTGRFAVPEVRQVLFEALKESQPFPAFPPNLRSSRKRFDLTISV